MLLAHSTIQIGLQFYCIEYHSGEPFRWKWNPAQALVSASTYDACPVLALYNTHFGFDGTNILKFDGIESLTGVYYVINGFDKTDYRINPKSEYVEKVSHSILSAGLNTTPGSYIGNFRGGGFYPTAETEETESTEIIPKTEYRTTWDPPTINCDCGGKKTFNETIEHFTVNHSPWCTLIKKGKTV